MLESMKKIFFILFLLLFVGAKDTFALNLIRDTETEEALLGYIRPIFSAAGLDPKNAQVIIVNDPSINAFVAGGQTIFVHTGLITQAKSVDDVVFVLSHETGHIVGGHIVRGYQAMQDAQTTALISTVLGGILAVAGGSPDAGIAIMMGGQTSAMGMFTKYRQTEESSADRIAVDIINKTGYSMTGFENIMKLLNENDRLSTYEDSGYLRTHPMTQDRVNDLKRFMEYPKPLQSDEKFDLIQAKLFGFLEKPDKVLKKYKGNSLTDIYAQSIALYRQHQFQKAFDKLNILIQKEPKNPYFYELKGQFLFETGQIEESEKYYKKASELKEDSVLIKLSYAQVLLEQNDTTKAKIAEGLLNYVTLHEPDTPFAWQLLGKAYDRQGKNKEAQYTMVEYERTIGKLPVAQERAKKLMDEFSPYSVIYQKLNDIVDLKVKKE